MLWILCQGWVWPRAVLRWNMHFAHVRLSECDEGPRPTLATQGVLTFTVCWYISWNGFPSLVRSPVVLVVSVVAVPDCLEGRWYQSLAWRVQYPTVRTSQCTLPPWGQSVIAISYRPLCLSLLATMPSGQCLQHRQQTMNDTSPRRRDSPLRHSFKVSSALCAFCCPANAICPIYQHCDTERR